MTGGHDARPTTDHPAGGAGAEHGLPVLAVGQRRHERQMAALARAAAEPTLAEADKDVRTLLAAIRMMGEWGLVTIGDALELAQARVRGARRRAGYDPT